jgi:predicted RNase H-like nuclease
MKGIETMFASMLGISAEQIAQMKEQLPLMLENARREFEEMKAKLEKVDQIDNNVRVLYRLLVDSGVIKPVPNDPTALPAVTHESNSQGRPS